MTKQTWIVVGALATLYVLVHRQKAAATTASGSPHPPSEDVAQPNLSGIDPAFGGSMVWANDRPTTNEVSPASTRDQGTNPVSDWLSRTFGIAIPQIAPAYNATASAPAVQNVPMNPGGQWQDGSLGMPAVPGTVPALTSEDAPSNVDLSDPSLLVAVMPFADDFAYVPDPVLF